MAQTSPNYDRATALVHEIGSLLIHDDAFGAWDGISVTTIIEPGVVQISGFSYEHGRKPKPSLPSAAALDGKFEELRDATQTPDGRKWKTALVRISRDTGKITIDYDYSDPLRWKVKTLNLATLPEEMRPK